MSENRDWMCRHCGEPFQDGDSCCTCGKPKGSQPTAPLPPMAPAGSTICPHGGEPLFCKICMDSVADEQDLAEEAAKRELDAHQFRRFPMSQDYDVTAIARRNFLAGMREEREKYNEAHAATIRAQAGEIAALRQEVVGGSWSYVKQLEQLTHERDALKGELDSLKLERCPQLEARRREAQAEVGRLTTLLEKAEKALMTVLNQPFQGDWDHQAVFVQNSLAALKDGKEETNQIVTPRTGKMP